MYTYTKTTVHYHMRGTETSSKGKIWSLSILSRKLLEMENKSELQKCRSSKLVWNYISLKKLFLKLWNYTVTNKTTCVKGNIF